MNLDPLNRHIQKATLAHSAALGAHRLDLADSIDRYLSGLTDAAELLGVGAEVSCQYNGNLQHLFGSTTTVEILGGTFRVEIDRLILA